MQMERMLSIVDSHTAGEPTRIVIGGLPPILGETMQKRNEFFHKELDFIRTSLVYEPRGHRDMVTAVITPPASPGAHFGVLFCNTGGYVSMCGHGMLGVATVALEIGMVAKEEPYTHLAIDTPVGVINVAVKVQNNRVISATLRNVPSFFVKTVEIDLPGGDRVEVDIAFGGEFFGIVDASGLQLRVDRKHIDNLIAAGLQLRTCINSQIKIQHPTLPHISSVELIEITDSPTNPKADAKNVTIFGAGQFDRSPCGTGTSAKMACLYSKGTLAIAEPFVNESILSTLFEGKIMEITHVGEFEAIVPEITGSAYVTAFNQIVIDREDPLKHGFHLF